MAPAWCEREPLAALLAPGQPWRRPLGGRQSAVHRQRVGTPLRAMSARMEDDQHRPLPIVDLLLINRWAGHRRFMSMRRGGLSHSTLRCRQDLPIVRPCRRTPGPTERRHSTARPLAACHGPSLQPPLSFITCRQIGPRHGRQRRLTRNPGRSSMSNRIGHQPSIHSRASTTIPLGNRRIEQPATGLITARYVR